MRSLVQDIIQEFREDPCRAAIEVVLNLLTAVGLLAILGALFLLAPNAEAVSCGNGLTVSPCWPDSQVPPVTVPIPGTAILLAVGGWLLFNMRK